MKKEYPRRAIRLSALVLALMLMLTVFSACGGSGGETAGTASGSTTPSDSSGIPESSSETDSGVIDADGDLIIFNRDKPVFTIVRGDRASDPETAAAVLLNKLIKEKTGERLGITTDYMNPGTEPDLQKAEILVGTTNRAESEKLNEEIGDRRFAVRADGNKIVIAAADSILLTEAVTYFMENCVKEKADGVFAVDRKLNYISEAGGSVLADMIKKADTFASSCDIVMTIPAPGNGVTVPQGGCFDGKHFYQLFIKKDTQTNEAENVDRIVKVEAATGKIVLVSDDLPLNHGNDITYNPKINKLVVVHNNPNRSTVTLIDPDTLTVTESRKLPVTIYCMDYNPQRDCYVVGISGGQDFRYLDADFNVISKQYAATPRTKGYVTQGMACTDELIFFVLFRESVITVYDWDGKLVTVIELSVGSIEPENISVYGDDIYVSCAKNGATVYRVTPKYKSN
ncbi:MAG: hypothetical protein MJ102_04300 [Clostridia bacterium]|nr:hypothetical protein [Clostridia bacterium]